MRVLIHRLLQSMPLVHSFIRRLRIRFVSKRALALSAQTSYSQVGEDLIVEYLMKLINIKSPTYLDIGAYHPVALSNTYRFYLRGCRGVCIEPDHDRCSLIANERPGDTCLNAGVGLDHRAEADFYVLTSADLCTFSREEAERLTQFGQVIERVVKVPLVPINSLMEKYFTPWPNFVSMDIEGIDLAVLKTLDFEKFRPEVFCLETLDSKSQRDKNTGLAEHMCQHGYQVFADTYINTIFVRSDLLADKKE